MSNVLDSFKKDISLFHNLLNNYVISLLNKKRDLAKISLKTSDFELKSKINFIFELIDDIKETKEHYDHIFETLKISEPGIASSVIDFFYKAFVDEGAKTQKEMYLEKLQRINDNLLSKKIIELEKLMINNNINPDNIKRSIMSILNKYIDRKIFLNNKISPIKYIDIILSSLFTKDPSYIMLNNYTTKIFNKKNFEEFKKDLIKLSLSDLFNNNVLKWNPVFGSDEIKQKAELFKSIIVFSDLNNKNDNLKEAEEIFNYIINLTNIFLNNYNKYKSLIKEELENLEPSKDENYELYYKFFNSFFDDNNDLIRLINKLLFTLKK